jgi:hypothetical protein
MALYHSQRQVTICTHYLKCQREVKHCFNLQFIYIVGSGHNWNNTEENYRTKESNYRTIDLSENQLIQMNVRM